MIFIKNINLMKLINNNKYDFVNMNKRDSNNKVEKV